MEEYLAWNNLKTFFKIEFFLLFISVLIWIFLDYTKNKISNIYGKILCFLLGVFLFFYGTVGIYNNSFPMKNSLDAYGLEAFIYGIVLCALGFWVSCYTLSTLTKKDTEFSQLRETKKCPNCNTKINSVATVCLKCGECLNKVRKP